MQDTTNTEIIMDLKIGTEQVIRRSEIEAQILRQQAKINWLRLGDENNRYFYTHVKVKHVHNDMRNLYKEDDTLLTNKEDIEN